MLWLALACGTPEPKVVPPEPKTVLGDVPAVSLTPAIEMFPLEVGLPIPLQGLAFGASEAEARAAVDAARETRVKLEVAVVDETTVIGGPFRGYDGGTLAVHLDGGRASALDVALPRAGLLEALTARWGAPTDAVTEGGPTKRWTAQMFTVDLDLTESKDGTAILMYRPR